MGSAELRKVAQLLRAAAASEAAGRQKRAAQVLDAAVALQLLRKKVQAHVQ